MEKKRKKGKAATAILKIYNPTTCCTTIVRATNKGNKQAVNGCVRKPEIAACTDLLHGESVIILFSSALVDQGVTRRQKDTTTTSNVFVLQFSVNEQLHKCPTA